MRERAEAPAVFFDFDNTITLGDVLDTVIERFSPQATWKEWEAEWQAGRMSTRAAGRGKDPAHERAIRIG